MQMIRATANKWTAAEDEAVKAAVADLGEAAWAEVAKCVFGRSGNQCRQRWVHTLSPGLARGKWSPEEDTRLIQLVAAAGGSVSWRPIAAAMCGRTTKQCRTRWADHLDPTLRRGPFTPGEDAVVKARVLAGGEKPCAVARQLAGRTGEMVKNRAKVLARRQHKQRKPLARTETWSFVSGVDADTLATLAVQSSMCISALDADTDIDTDSASDSDCTGTAADSALAMLAAMRALEGTVADSACDSVMSMLADIEPSVGSNDDGDAKLEADDVDTVRIGDLISDLDALIKSEPHQPCAECEPRPRLSSGKRAAEQPECSSPDEYRSQCQRTGLKFDD